LMRIDILTAVPDLITSPFESSILKIAIEKGLVSVHIHNLRDYSSNNYKQIDDYQYGGGAGMVLMIEPIDKCITKLKSERDYDEIIYMPPDREPLTQGHDTDLSLKKNIIMLCGHSTGADNHSSAQFITREITIGDYVLRRG